MSKFTASLLAVALYLVTTTDTVKVLKASKFKVWSCTINGTPYYGSSLGPEIDVVVSGDKENSLYQWNREEDGGIVSGHIYSRNGKILTWSCAIAKEANSEDGRQKQSKIISNCDKIDPISGNIEKFTVFFPDGLCNFEGEKIDNIANQR